MNGAFLQYSPPYFGKLWRISRFSRRNQTLILASGARQPMSFLNNNITAEYLYGFLPDRTKEFLGKERIHSSHQATDLLLTMGFFKSAKSNGN